MTTKTRNDLVRAALAKLQVLAAGQTPVAEDFDEMDGHVDATIAELDADDIVTVFDVEEIPVEWFEPIAVILADNAAFSFGLPGVPASPANPNPVASAQDKLRLRVRGKPTGQAMKGEYY